jgi:hypothetical protein
MSTPGGEWRTGSLNPGTGGNRDTYMPEAGTLATQAERAAAAEHDARMGRRPRIEVVPTIIGVALLVLGALLIISSNPGGPPGTFNESVLILGAIPAIVGMLLIASRLARLRRKQLDLR